MTRFITLLALSLTLWAGAEDFSDRLGHSLTVENVHGRRSFWVVEDGRSAMTGPTMDPAEATKLANLLKTGWVRRSGKWKADFESGRDWVSLESDSGALRCVTGDSKHTPKSFTIDSVTTLNAICKALGSSPAGGSIESAPKYPTR